MEKDLEKNRFREIAKIAQKEHRRKSNFRDYVEAWRRAPTSDRLKARAPRSLYYGFDGPIDGMSLSVQAWRTPRNH